jgi:hypothetical protein
MSAQPSSDFDISFSTKVARVLGCTDSTGIVEFTLDSGPAGDKSICLEHHPSNWPRGERYNHAFRRAKEFLESCGYDVDIYGDA